jgi:hypothetical protein
MRNYRASTMMKMIHYFDGDEDDPLCPSTSSLNLVPAFTLEAEAPQATTSSTAAVEVSQVEGKIISKSDAPSHSEGTSTSINYR